VSGAPGRSTLNCSASGFWKSHSAIIHRTVQCGTGLSGVPAEQRLQHNGRLQRKPVKALQCAESESRRQKAHQTVNSACPVRHRTVRCPSLTELQRSNPNGWLTWLEHRTVSGGAPDCPVRPSTDNLPNDHFGGWGYKYPQPPHFKASKFSAIAFNTRALYSTPRHKTKDQILSKSQTHSKDLVACERETFVFI
jgi:hypothetical protein